MYFEDLPQEVQDWIRTQHKSFAIVVRFTNNSAPIQYIDITDDPDAIKAVKKAYQEYQKKKRNEKK